MEFSAGQIADLLNGRVDGDPDTKIHNLSKIEEGEKGTMTFLANPKYASFIYTTQASIAIVNETFEAEQPLPEFLTLIRVQDAYASFAQLLKIYEEMISSPAGVHESAFIDANANVDSSASIGAGCVVSAGSTVAAGAILHGHCFIGPGVAIGEKTVLHPGVKVLARCEVGSECTLHSGVVIGSDGFGFAPNSENNYQKVPQIGNVVVEDHVEIGANSTIDRATLGTTRICRGVKLDNLIQVAHNVEIGENTVIAAQTGIAGSTKIGKNCMIGGQVGIIGHLNIADEVKIAAQSGIGSSIDVPGTIVQGSPAFGIGDYKKSYVGFRKLPQIMRELSDLKKSLDNR